MEEVMLKKSLESFSEQIMQLNTLPGVLADVKLIEGMIARNPLLVPHILSLCSAYLTDFQTSAKRKQDHLLREALGDAVHLLSKNKKPQKMHVHCTRIKKAIFPNGVNNTHHQGEKDFFNRYLSSPELEDVLEEDE